MRYLFINSEKANYPTILLCQVLEVSSSGFYDWLKRIKEPSPRKRASQVIYEYLRKLYNKHRGWYGSRRYRTALERQYGLRVGRNRILSLMRKNGLKTKRPKAYRVTTDSNHKNPVAENLLERNFSVAERDEVWVADISYIPTKQGWLYLAIVLDLFSRRIVGWSMSPSLHRQICLDALQMALINRRPSSGLIHHSDRGSQYASGDYRELLENHQMRCSMSRRGDCWDNAVAESFFGTLKSELLYDRKFETRKEAMLAIFEYIEVYYNRERQHSTIDYFTPVEFEQNCNLLTQKTAA